MATLEQRLQAVEQAIANSKITPNLPSLNTLVGDELLPVWSNSLQNTVQYPLGNLVGGGGASAINDVIPVFKKVSGIDYESNTAINAQIASIINADTSFAKTENQFLILFTLRIGNGSSVFTQNISREYYIFTGVKGNYGDNATQISSQDIVFFVSDKDDSRENAIFDLGEIGDTSQIQDEVNTSGPYDPSVAQLIVFKSQRSGIEFDFLYVGQTTSEIGINETQTTLDDFLNLNTATPDAPPEADALDTALDINSNNAVTNATITQAINNITTSVSARGTGISSSFTVTAANGGTVFTLSSLKFEISSDEGYLANNPSEKLNVTVENLNANSTFVYYNKDGDLEQQTTYPTTVEFVRKAFVARIVIDVNVNEIIGFEYFYNPLGQYSNLIRTVVDYVKEAGVPLKKGLTVTGKNNSLGFGIGAGSLLRFGGTGNSLEPSTPSFANNENVSFVLADRDSADSGGNTVIPKFWDNNGVKTPLGSTTVSGSRLYFFNSGVVALQLGQGNYANMTLAKAGVKLEEYVVNPLSTNATLLGWWLVESTATASAGTAKAQFVEYTIGVQGGSSSSLSGALLIGNNLSDIGDAGAAIINLGIDLLLAAKNPLIPHLEFDNIDKTIWNSGKAGIERNTAYGKNALSSNTTGFNNTAYGLNALRSNETGSNNTANGTDALRLNTTGFANTANGVSALGANTTGGSNTANGVNALSLNTTGGSNTANGVSALRLNTTGFANTANGVSALGANTTGGSNTANGVSALSSNTTGGANTANGVNALSLNTTGGSNTANGVSALSLNETGSNNTAFGIGAGGLNRNSNDSVFIGSQTKSKQEDSTNEIVIGNDATGEGSNTVVLGNDDIENTYLKGDVHITKNLITNVKTKTSATSYLFQTSNKTVAPLFTSSSAVSAVIKLNTPIGTKFVLSQFGTGEVTIIGESGVTLRFPSTELAVPESQYSFIQLEVIDTNEVAVIGRLKQA
jgi:hypothetical protein